MFSKEITYVIKKPNEGNKAVINFNTINAYESDYKSGEEISG